MKSFLLLALCVVLSLASPMSIMIRLNNNATAGTQSTESIFVSNENPYVTGRNIISQVAIGVSLVGILPPNLAVPSISPDGASVVGAIAPGSYAPYHFDIKGDDAGLWMLKVTVTYKDENFVDRSKEKYFPYVIKPKTSAREVAEDSNAELANNDDWVMKQESSLQSRGTCPAGSTNEIIDNGCSYSSQIDTKTWNTMGFYPNGVTITSIVALNASSTACTTYKSEMALATGCTTPITSGTGCGINFAINCGACGQSCVNIYIYYKTSTTLGAPTKTWYSGCINFVTVAGAGGCRRDVQEVANQERAIESGRIRN